MAGQHGGANRQGIQEAQKVVAKHAPAGRAARIGRQFRLAMAAHIQGDDAKFPGEGAEKMNVRRSVKTVRMCEDQRRSTLRRLPFQKGNNAIR